MRKSVVLLLCSLAGVIGGAALIGVAAIGGAVIFDSLCVGVYALLRDDSAAAPRVRDVPGAAVTTLAEIFDRARAS